MLLRKPSLLLPTSSTLLSLSHPSPKSSTSRLTTHQQTRSYAKEVADEPHNSDHNPYRDTSRRPFPLRSADHPTNHFPNPSADSPRDPSADPYTWPIPSPPTRPLTPYEILSHPLHGPYTKARFNALVKLYHPDLHHLPPSPSHPSNSSHNPHPHPSISPSERLERYRLIIAAHTLLSSPTRRQAYDTHGHGWDHAPNLPTSSAGAPKRQWPKGMNPLYNATWEDWERWYEATSPSPSRPAPQTPFVPNGTFVVVLLLCAFLGGLGQASRAGIFSASLLEQREQVHADAARNLRRSRLSAVGASRSESIERFIREHDPEGLRKGYYLGYIEETCESGRTGKGGERRRLWKPGDAVGVGVEDGEDGDVAARPAS